MMTIIFLTLLISRAPYIFSENAHVKGFRFELRTCETSRKQYMQLISYQYHASLRLTSQQKSGRQI